MTFTNTVVKIFDFMDILQKNGSADWKALSKDNKWATDKTKAVMIFGFSCSGCQLGACLKQIKKVWKLSTIYLCLYIAYYLCHILKIQLFISIIIILIHLSVARLR